MLLISLKTLWKVAPVAAAERIHADKNGAWSFSELHDWSERERALCWLPLGLPFQRRPLCGHHIMQVHFIDLMEHADMVFKASQYETEAVFRRFES